MPSTLTWLDHDPKERERITRILGLFQERGTVDELGLGAIRDSFSDKFFPGTSTIQTRLRYFLFVPWMYQDLETRGTRWADIGARARKFELKLAEPLLKGPELGIFGRSARGDLKRLPSEVYWGGLRSWGILHFAGSQEQYHRSVDEIYRRRRLVRRSSDGDLSGDSLLLTWHPGIPAPPSGWPENATIDLEREEAEFVLDRIRRKHPDSLLCRYAEYPEVPETDDPWEHPLAGSLSSVHRRLLYHARLFSETLYGATVLYNLLLARLAGSADLHRSHADQLESWEDAIDRAEIRQWNLNELFNLLAGHGHTITPHTRDFVFAWVREVLAGPGLNGRESAARMVRQREMMLKGSHSKFTNRRVLDEHWRGFSSMYRHVYRWPKVRVLLQDLRAGLER